MSYTPQGGFETHEYGEANGEQKANTAYAKMELFCGFVKDRDLTTPPGSPSNGDAYIMPSGSLSGAWSEYDENDIALYLNGWIQIVPWGGLSVYLYDEKIWLGYSSQESQWHPMQRTWSTTEYWTGEYFGGSKLYAKTIDVGTLPSSTSSTDAHGISNLGTVVRIIAMADNATNQIPIPNVSSSLDVEIYVDDTNINLVTTDDMSGYSGKVTLEYTKTA